MYQWKQAKLNFLQHPHQINVDNFNNVTSATSKNLKNKKGNFLKININ